MSQRISDYIFKNSIAPFGHKLCLRNETSHTSFVKTELILIKELRDDGITLELPVNVCQKGHNLTLFFMSQEHENKIVLPISGHFKEALFEAMAKVEKLEDTTVKKGIVFVELHFTQYDIAEWRKIFKMYSQSQDEINELLTKQHEVRDLE